MNKTVIVTTAILCATVVNLFAYATVGALGLFVTIGSGMGLFVLVDMLS